MNLVFAAWWLLIVVLILWRVYSAGLLPICVDILLTFAITLHSNMQDLLLIIQCMSTCSSKSGKGKPKILHSDVILSRQDGQRAIFPAWDYLLCLTRKWSSLLTKLVWSRWLDIGNGLIVLHVYGCWLCLGPWTCKKKNEPNIQQSWPYAWSITQIGKKWPLDSWVSVTVKYLGVNMSSI